MEKKKGEEIDADMMADKTVAVIHTFFFFSNRIFIDLVAHATIVTEIQADTKPILWGGGLCWSRWREGKVEVVYVMYNTLSTNFTGRDCVHMDLEEVQSFG
jgi:hypothetical protein